MREINHGKSKKSDRGAAGKADPARQPAAGAVQPAASAVQHVGRCGRWAVRGFYGAGRGGVNQHFCHAVHRLPDRSQQRHQCAGGALLRRAAPERCKKDRPLGAYHQPCGGRYLIVRRPARLARAAGTAQHQAGSAARRNFVPACVLLGHACAGAV